jgi:predicted GNAT family acetyltransferase
MKYYIRQVDNKDKSVQAVLIDLQAIVLDGSPIAKPSIGYWWIVYTEEDEAVGFAAMKQSSQFTDCVYLNRCGILSKHRGKGLQKRLVKVRLQKAKCMGFNWAVTDTTFNPASANSLINCGFKMYEPSKPWSWTYSSYWRLKV